MSLADESMYRASSPNAKIRAHHIELTCPNAGLSDPTLPVLIPSPSKPSQSAAEPAQEEGKAMPILPWEIILHIIDLVLYNVTLGCGTRFSSSVALKDQWTIGSIARVCKALHKPAISRLYEDDLVFFTMKGLSQFLQHLISEYLDAARRRRYRIYLSVIASYFEHSSVRNQYHLMEYEDLVDLYEFLRDRCQICLCGLAGCPSNQTLCFLPVYPFWINDVVYKHGRFQLFFQRDERNGLVQQPASYCRVCDQSCPVHTLYDMEGSGSESLRVALAHKNTLRTAFLLEGENGPPYGRIFTCDQLSTLVINDVRADRTYESLLPMVNLEHLELGRADFDFLELFQFCTGLQNESFLPKLKRLVIQIEIENVHHTIDIRNDQHLQQLRLLGFAGIGSTDSLRELNEALNTLLERTIKRCETRNIQYTLWPRLDPLSDMLYAVPGF